MSEYLTMTQAALGKRTSREEARQLRIFAAAECILRESGDRGEKINGRRRFRRKAGTNLVVIGEDLVFKFALSNPVIATRYEQWVIAHLPTDIQPPEVLGSVP